MNKEQQLGIEKTLGISISPLAKNLIDVATAFCWQPLKIENGLMVLGVYEKDPLKLIENNAREISGKKTETGRIEFLQIELGREKLSEIDEKFKKEIIVTPLNHAKYGEKSQHLFDEAKKALVIGDYERSAEKVREASRGNPTYNAKQKHISESLDAISHKASKEVSLNA